MENEKFHDLPSASWRPRRAGSMIPSKSKGLRSKSAKSRRRSMSQLKQSDREGSILPFSIFCSVQTFNRLDDAHLH